MHHSIEYETAVDAERLKGIISLLFTGKASVNSNIAGPFEVTYGEGPAHGYIYCIGV